MVARRAISMPGPSPKPTLTGGTQVDHLEQPLSEEERRKFAFLIAQAWADETVAAEYARHPHAVLAEFGIAYPSDAQAPQIPARPDGDIEVEDLELVAGADFNTRGSASTAGTASCPATIGTAGCLGSAETDPITLP
jgi:hypothetical protein